MRKDKQRGAVSVFLAIILVPCIVISSIFVDLSRVKLGRSVVVSSADLALNSLMSYYDKDLSQIYGMMASCQNIEQFYDETAQFFLDALYSQGLGEDDIDSLIGLYSSVVGDDSVYDLLQLEVQTEKGEIIAEVNGANLGESSTVIRDQIVDFMKYRGPVKILEGIVERLRTNNVATTLKDASQNEELVNDKRDYAEATGDMLDDCYKSYCYLVEYVKLKPTLIELKNISNKLVTYRELYREINQAMVFNFSNTSGLAQFSRPVYGINTYATIYTKDKKGVYSRKETVDDVVHYYVDADDIRSENGKSGIIPDMEKKIKEFETAKTNLINEASSWIDMGTGSGSGQANEIQWWVHVHNAINKGNNSYIKKYETAAKEMLEMYSKMSAMLDCEDGKEVPENWREDCKNLQSQVRSLQSTYLKAGVKNNNDRYLKLVNRLETISANNISNINPSTYRLSNGKTISTTVSEIKSELDGYRRNLDEYIEALNIVINGNFLKGVKSLDSLKDSIDEYNDAFEKWEGTANRLAAETTDTESMPHKDLEEIETERNAYAGITIERVTELKTRLVNIKEQMTEVRDAIDSVKYCSKSLSSYATYENVYNAVKSKINISQAGMTNGELAAYAEEIFQSAFVPYTANVNDKVFSLSHENDTNYNPDLTVSKPALYKYWEDKYGNPEDKEKEISENRDKIKNGKKDAEDGEAEQKNKERNASDVSDISIYENEAYVAADFPSGLDAQNTYALGTSILDSLSGLVDSLTSGTYTNIRDSLYSTEYVMDMFSYSTYTNEGKYRLYKKQNPDKEVSDKEAPINTQEINTLWTETSPIATYNKTLTNEMINSENNVAYGAEVEYVLYGKTNKENIRSAYADIFAIRYPLNLVSGFQHFWSGTEGTAGAINLTARSVFSATSGVIPEMVTKSVLIALLAVAETGMDLDRLSNGLPVEVYKSDEQQWRISMEDWQTNPNKAERTNSSGLFYSDYLYMFLYLGFESQSASEMYLRIGDLIQANMRKRTGKNEYVLKNARTYFTLEATVRVKPLMLTLPYALPYSNNPKDKTDWCTFTIKETRGYS